VSTQITRSSAETAAAVSAKSVMNERASSTSCALNAAGFGASCRLTQVTPGTSSKGRRRAGSMERLWSLKCFGLPTQARPTERMPGCATRPRHAATASGAAARYGAPPAMAGCGAPSSSGRLIIAQSTSKSGRASSAALTAQSRLAASSRFSPGGTRSATGPPRCRSRGR